MLVARDKTPCDEVSTSFAWVDPTGKVIKLPGRQNHVEWAWRQVHGAGWNEDFDWDEGMGHANDLVRDGWVRVSNSFTMEFDESRVSSQAMRTAIDNLIQCTVQGHKDPEKEIVWATTGRGVVKEPVVKFIQLYGTRAQEDALFGQLLRISKSPILKAQESRTPMSLRSACIRLASSKPELRLHLLPLLKEAMEFDTQEAMEKYLKEHPDADKSNHSVKKKDTPKPQNSEKKWPKYDDTALYSLSTSPSQLRTKDQARDYMAKVRAKVWSFKPGSEDRKKFIDAMTFGLADLLRTGRSRPSNGFTPEVADDLKYLSTWLKRPDTLQE